MRKFLVAVLMALSSAVFAEDKYPDYAIKEIRQGFLEGAGKDGDPSKCSVTEQAVEGMGTVLTFKCSFKPFVCEALLPPEDIGNVIFMGCEHNPEFVEPEKLDKL